MGAAASGIQAQMRTEHDETTAFPWWVRLLAKALAVFGGFLAVIFAVLGLFTFNCNCIIATLLQLAFGLLTVALEAPFCCMCVEFIEKIALFSESRKHWHKAVLFCTMGAIPIILCFGISTFVGSGLIFASGVVYGFMALGKKADLSAGPTDAAWNATVNQPPPSINNPPMA
uniref:Calcium channel flower n=1 Tax=Syphacia muris TaxID=451379 RepID=A0A0N5AUJ3_9BILA